MSRSYKKFPQVRDNLWGKSLKKGKTYNNRKIRRYLKNPNIDVGNNKDYLQYGLDSWDLWEYKSYQTKADAISKWEQDQTDMENGIRTWKTRNMGTVEEAILDWYKWYKRK